MANSQIFNTKTRAPDTVNAAGGTAHGRSDKEALAQAVVAGFIGDTYYSTAKENMEDILRLAGQIDDSEFLARCAVYGRRSALMKDTPVLLIAILFARRSPLAPAVFSKVIDNSRQVRTLVQILRSGVLGSRTIPRPARRCIREWIGGLSAPQIVKASVGNDPSLADIIKMVHPVPSSGDRSSLYRWVIGKYEGASAMLPEPARGLERRKRGESEDLPAVSDFRLVAGKPMSTEEWKEAAMGMGWMALRMNLNTLLRHGALDESGGDLGFIAKVAGRIGDPEEIRKARQMPYQIYAAVKNIDDEMPNKIKDALHDAVEVACENVPHFSGKTAICVDTSGSMSGLVSGDRRSSIRCIEVAALIAAAIVRRCDDARVIEFGTVATISKVSGRDSIPTIASVLSSRYGGGTNMSAGVRKAIEFKPDNIIVVSDNESWSHSFRGYGFAGSKSKTSGELFETYKKNFNPSAKMALIDLTASSPSTTQAKTSDGVMNIGGFSDSVFSVLGNFFSDNPVDFVDIIDSVDYHSPA